MDTLKPAAPEPDATLRETLLAVRAKLKVALHLAQDRAAARRKARGRCGR